MLVAAGLAAVAGLAGYGAWVEPRRIEVTRHLLRPPRWPVGLDGLSILHLSDLHTRGRGPVEAYLARLADALPVPDLVVATGDFAEGPDRIAPCCAALAAVPARYGRYAVLGNNDYAPQAHHLRLLDGLTAAGYRVLLDQHDSLELPGGRLRIGGLHYYFVRFTARRFRYPVGELFGTADGAARLLLSHSPDALPEAAAAGVDLMLSGHTHGGQICLPGGRPVHSNLYRRVGRSYLQGEWHRESTLLYVSRGLGMSDPRLRLWCRPEVAWLTIGAPQDSPAGRGNDGLEGDV
ncbi:MAG: metallophosphoesterase [Fimbriimonadaceae bacterium]|nr:metallophosphoesterase [Fimbriimonadaceae bacterium]